MKAAHKSISQKGLSPIIIVIVLAVIGLGAFVFYNNSQKTPGTTSVNNSVSNNQLNQPTSETISGLDKVDETNYIFYYPRGYVKGQLMEGANGLKDVLNYTNSNTKAITAERIFLRVSQGSKKLGIPNYQFCQKLAEGTRKKGDDDVKAEVIIGSEIAHTKGVGCMTTIKSNIEGVNDAAVTIEKDLWDQKEDPGPIYIVGAVYFENASKDQAELLKGAVESFTLK